MPLFVYSLRPLMLSFRYYLDHSFKKINIVPSLSATHLMTVTVTTLAITMPRKKVATAIPMHVPVPKAQVATWHVGHAAERK